MMKAASAFLAPGGPHIPAFSMQNIEHLQWVDEEARKSRDLLWIMLQRMICPCVWGRC
jgi:hypothetical protein